MVLPVHDKPRMLPALFHGNYAVAADSWNLFPSQHFAIPQPEPCMERTAVLYPFTDSGCCLYPDLIYENRKDGFSL